MSTTRVPPTRVFIEDVARMVGGDFADNRGGLAEWVRLHRCQNTIGLGGRKNREEFTFIGDIERIETEDLAGSLDFFANGNLRFIEQHAHPGRLGNFAQCAGNASTVGSRKT
jgi:hypothetical protein